MSMAYYIVSIDILTDSMLEATNIINRLDVTEAVINAEVVKHD